MCIKTKKHMKKVVGLFLLAAVIFSACAPKSYYKTAEGKRKQKYYNEIQFGGKSAATMKRKF